MGLGAPLAVDVAAATASGVGIGVFGVLWSTMMQVKIAPDALSRVSSYDAMGSPLFQPIGLLLGGPAITLLGVRGAMLTCGLGLIVVSLSSLVSRDVRRVRWRGPVHLDPA